MTNATRIYSVVLTVLGVCAALGCGLLLFLAGAAAGGTAGTHLPDGSLLWVALINGAYALAILVTLCARYFRPATGRAWTRVLNWALLPAFPGGTAVGLYGLWRADREPR